MNTKDIRTSKDTDLAGSYASIQRSAKSARDIAINSSTAIIVAADSKSVRIKAAEFINRCEHRYSHFRQPFKTEGWRP